MRVPLMTGLPTSTFGSTRIRSCQSISFSVQVSGRLKQSPLRLVQLLLLVEQSLHQLLLLVAVGQNLADGLGDEPEGRVLGLAAAGQELGHALRIARLPKDTKPVEHV